MSGTSTTDKRIRLIAWLAVFAIIGGIAFSPGVTASGTGYMKPAGGATALRFSARYFDASLGKTRTHHGIDINAGAGALIKASSDGKVVFAGKTPLGLCVSLLHCDGVKTTYLPLAGLAVSRGDKVRQGSVIGSLAPGGDLSSSVSHLHMGAIFAGEYIDPEVLFSGMYKTDLTKLIRRGNIPPGGADVEEASGVNSVYSWPVISAIVDFFSGGVSLLTRAWSFFNKTASFLSSQASFLYKWGAGFFSRQFRKLDLGSAFDRLPALKRAGIRRFFLPSSVNAPGLTVFDPSGDKDDQDDSLLISLDNGNLALGVEVYDANSSLVRRLEGWNQPYGFIAWSGDNDEGQIVEDGIYSVVIRISDGTAKVMLAEVRWHL